MKTTTKRNYENTLLIFFIYALLFIVFLFNFFDTDDYSMQTSYSALSIANGLDFSIHYGNGRFIGNLALYYFNFYPITRMVFKPMVLTVLIGCIIYVFEIKKLWLKIATALLIIMPSSGFYAKCYSSNPCIMNYVAPLANVFVCFALMKIIGRRKKKMRLLLYTVLFIASICMQFYSENATVIFLATAVFLIAYKYFTEKKFEADHIIFFIGGIIGAALMFIVPKHISYSVIGENVMSSYRQIIFNIPFAIGVVAKFAEYFSTAAIWIVIFGAVLTYIVIKESPDDKFKLWHIVFSNVYPAVCVFYKFTQTEEAKVISSVKLFLMVLMFAFLLNALIIIFRFIKDIKTKSYSVFAIFALAMSVGMFMILTLHGYRTFYLSLIIFVSLTIYLASYIVNEYGIRLEGKVLRVLNVTAVSALLCFAVLLPLQTIQNYDVFAMRQEYVDEKISQGEKLVYVPKVPNKNLVRDEFLHFYKDYFTAEHQDVDIVFIDIEDWERFEEYQSMMDNPLTSITYAVSHLQFSN